MARRKSINKRLSRYSRQSAGSAILDPDTNILTEEDPYWWRNLDNNTIARLSVDSNAFNQTSRHLDSNTQVETSLAEDGWWKVLDASNTPSKSKTNVDNAKKDATNSTPESESEGEPRIAKRKFPFRSEVRRAEGNAFLNALNDSAQTAIAGRAQKSRRKDSMNNVASHSKTVTDITKAQENSLDESHSSNNILKLRPEVFKRNYKTRNKNAFVDILKEDQLQSSSKEKSLKITSNNESHIGTEHRAPATAETSTSNQTEPNEFALSFENEHDLSRYPAPKAQSTIIEGGNWTVPDKVEDNSNVENEIVKPRSKLMTRHRKNIKKNLLDDVFAEQETTNKKGDLINQNATGDSNISESTLKQANNSLTEARNIVADDKYSRKKVHTSSMSKRNEHMVESAQNVKESIVGKLQEEVSLISSDRSEGNRESSTVRKTKSRLLTSSRENAEKNRFQDILVAWNDVDTSGSRNSEISLSREKKEEDVAVKNVVSVENKSKRSKIDKGSHRHLSDLRTELLDNSNEGNIPISTVENDKNYNKKTKQSTRTPSESELYGVQDVSNKASKNASALERQSFLHNTEAIKSTSKRITRNSNSRHGQLDSHDIEKAAEVESPETQDISKRLRTRSGKLQNYSLMRSMNESDLEKTEDTPRRNKRSTSRITEQSSSHATEKAVEVESPETRDVSKRQRTRSGKLQNYSLMRSMNESDLEKTEDTPRRNKRSTSRIKERSKSSIMRQVESPKAENVPSKGQNDRQGTSSKRSRLSMNQKQSDPLVSEEDEPAEALDVSTRQSERLSNERTYLFPESTTGRSTRSLSTAQKRSTLPALEEAESTQTQYTPMKQTDLQSKSQKYPRSRITNESESNKTQSPSRRSNRNLSRGRVEQSVSPAARKAKRSGVQTASQKRSERFTNTQSYLSLPNETELESQRVEKATNNILPSARMLNTNVQKGQQTIKSFFSSDKTLPASQVFLDKEKVEEIKRELDRVKECEMARMKQDQQNHETKTLSLREKLMNKRGMNKKVALQKQRSNKQVHKAFLVNGHVYKAPRLPRPQRWITDRLYKYLWKRMEPKYKLETRVASEKFVQQLSNVTTLIIKRKSYIHYKTELHALMKEMARLDIIKNRHDFYNFCQDFFPYELRIKTVPMLLPGNKRNIPYDADKLHEPLLSP